MLRDYEAAAIPRSFYFHDTVQVAQCLLGRCLVRRVEDTFIVGKIVETEAYLAFDDPAAHNFKGKTKRTEVLYGEPGHTYVHGLRQYFCLDVVTEEPDRPASVLIRALEPVAGIDLMKQFRKSEDLINLTNGPGKLCQALDITRELNAVDVTTPTSPVFIADLGPCVSTDAISRSKRIGISKATDLLLRFSVRECPFVSRG